jgi:hypothetical protein
LAEIKLTVQTKLATSEQGWDERTDSVQDSKEWVSSTATQLPVPPKLRRQPALDPGLKPGGIRERALAMVMARYQAATAA